jgi:hypothetical protein
MKNGHINSEKSEHQAMKVRWSQIGTYRVIGSTCDWVCKIALHRHKNGLWSARWKGEECAQEILGPAKLGDIFGELLHLGVEEENLLSMLETSSLSKAREFAVRTRTLNSLSIQDSITNQLMMYWRPGKAVRLKASWADDVAIAKIRVEADDWLQIAQGESVDLDGGYYCYEGSRFSTYWRFNFPSKGEVAVYYSPLNGDSDEGEGYIGGIQSLIESPKCS